MKQTDFQMAFILLEQEGLVLPYDTNLPGTFPGGGVHVGRDESTWNAYQWNPPQYTRTGQFYSFGWGHPNETASPKQIAGMQVAYMAKDTNPGRPSRDVLEHRVDEAHVPSGWTSSFPSSGTVWYITRDVNYIGPEHAQDAPDKDASPKPTWSQIVAAATKTVLSSARAEAYRLLRKECRRRITVAYDAEDLNDEILTRLRGGATADQDAARDTLLASYRKVKAWIYADSRTSQELERFDPEKEEHWT